MTAGRGVFLAGDIGGTSTRLGLFEVTGGRLSLVAGERFASREHAGLAPIVRRFLDAHGHAVERACVGVAGPVIGRHVETPNLAWDVDADTLARELGLARVDLINDLEANSHGIFTLTPEDWVVLNPGDAGARGNAGIISAGTGLGEAGMYWDGRHHHPFACEGGHADYAPHSDVEIDLLRHLRARFGAHVSWERVVSGPGLLNIYEFLRDTGRGSEPPWLREAMAAGDPSRSSPRRPSPDGASCATARSTCSSPPTARRRGTSRSRSWPRAASTSAAASRRRSSRGSPRGPSWRRSRPRAGSPTSSPPSPSA